MRKILTMATDTSNNNTKPTLRLNSFKRAKADFNAKEDIKTESLVTKNSTKEEINTSVHLDNHSNYPLHEVNYLKILEYLQTHYPKTFPAAPQPPVPLAIGIHEQLLERGIQGFSRTATRKFLARYVRTIEYRNSSKTIKKRYNLDGSVASSTGTTKKEKSSNLPHDALVKKIMENPITASEFLEEFLTAEFKDMFDFTTLKVEKESYIEDSLKKRLSDIVYSISTKPKNDDEEPETAFIYTVLEHQSTSDYWIALRLWKYSLLLLERHVEEKNKLPLILPLVLYNGKKRYSAPRNLWELFARPELARKSMAENYHLVDLHAMSDEDIDYEKHLSFVLFTMKHIHDRDTLKMLKEAMQRCTKALIIDKGKDYVHTKLILWYTDTKIPEKNKQLLEQLIVDNLPKEDTEKLMKTIADSYREEGIAIGEARGIEKGAMTKAQEITRRMLQEQVDIKLITSVTGLSTDEILKIQNKL